jgi:redox-sensitive bicupin YhaK (pirin superfamily)
MGHKQALHPNEVQVMSAGSGITHSEYNHNQDKKVNLLQIWIFPNKRNVTPRYEQTVFAVGERVNKFQALVSPIENDEPGLKIHQEAWIYRSSLENGKSLQHKLHSDKQGVYIFLISGSVTVNGKALGKKDAVGLSGIESVEITASTDSDVLLLEVPMYA